MDELRVGRIRGDGGDGFDRGLAHDDRVTLHMAEALAVADDHGVEDLLGLILRDRAGDDAAARIFAVELDLHVALGVLFAVSEKALGDDGLGVLAADDLRFAVLSDDAKKIAKTPGIGAKTAQKIILELKDKLDLQDAFEKKLAAPTVGAEVAAAAAGNSVVQDAVEALVALGYGSTESLKAVRSVNPDEHMDVETVLKAALKHLF